MPKEKSGPKEGKRQIDSKSSTESISSEDERGESRAEIDDEQKSSAEEKRREESTHEKQSSNAAAGPSDSNSTSIDSIPSNVEEQEMNSGQTFRQGICRKLVEIGRRRTESVGDNKEEYCIGQLAQVPAGIELRTKRAGNTTYALLDSGSSGNFLSLEYAQHNKIEFMPCTQKFRVADGAQVETVGWIEQYQYKSGKKKFSEEMYILDKLSRNMILGLPWLKKHDPKISFKSQEVEIKYQGE